MFLTLPFVGIIREMSGQSCLISLLWSLHGINNQARVMVDRIGKASANGPEKQWVLLDINGSGLARADSLPTKAAT